jgi:hypothetical protein
LLSVAGKPRFLRASMDLFMGLETSSIALPQRGKQELIEKTVTRTRARSPGLT